MQLTLQHNKSTIAGFIFFKKLVADCNMKHQYLSFSRNHSYLSDIKDF